MLSNTSILKLIINLIVYVVFLGLLVLYLLGMASKGSILDFLNHSASVGDILIIVGAGVYILDDLGSSKAQIIDDNIQSRLDKIEYTILKTEGLLKSSIQLKDNYS